MSIAFRRAAPPCLALGFALLGACASGPRPVEPGTEIDMGDFSVRSPKGAGWEVQENAKAGMVIFTRHRPGGADSAGNTMVLVATQVCLMKDPLPSQEALGNQWMDEEVRIMNTLGVKPGHYKLFEGQKGTTQIGGKRVQSMSYRQESPSRVGRDAWEMKSVVYTYFPANFQKTRRMYCFRIGELNYVNRPGNSTDLSQIAPVLESFRVK